MLYHVSIRSWEIIDEFVPRIPESRCELIRENDSIPRICLSDSIKGCLSGVSWGGLRLLTDPFFNKDDKIIAIIRVYEFNRNSILTKHILDPEKVKNHVLDAEITGEHWVVNQSLKPDNSHLIALKNVKLEPKVINQNNKGFLTYKVKGIKYIKISKKDEDMFIKKFNKEKGKVLAVT